MTADRLWLSPAGAHDAVGLHFTWLRSATAASPDCRR